MGDPKATIAEASHDLIGKTWSEACGLLWAHDPPMVPWLVRRDGVHKTEHHLGHHPHPATKWGRVEVEMENDLITKVVQVIPQEEAHIAYPGRHYPKVQA